MIRSTRVWQANHESSLADLGLPLDLGAGCSHLEIELGFGKGRHILSRALAEPHRRFVGIESGHPYFSLLNHRAGKRGVSNLVTILGDALYIICACLEPGIAAAVHIYFPDPWPKSRHQRRRLLEPETIDLILSLLRPGGHLLIATDHLEYGSSIRDILLDYPGLALRQLHGGWPGGVRTNYEIKYQKEGRQILRLEAILDREHPGVDLHPSGVKAVLADGC